MALCSSRTGFPYSEAEIADYAALKVRDVKSGLVELERRHMIEWDSDIGAWWVTKWSERQYESDEVALRTRKHRSNGKDRNVPTSVVGTHQNRTETEQSRTENPSVELELDVQVESSNPVEGVFKAWQEATHHHKAVLDPKRRKCITAALKHYSPEDLEDACRGVMLFPHNRGETNGTRYDDLTLVLRDSEHIERFRDQARVAPVATLEELAARAASRARWISVRAMG